MVMMGVVVFFSMIDLGCSIIEEIKGPPVGVIGVARLPDLLGLFLWVLIALEFHDSVRMYLREHAVHVETVLSVGMIAIANKVIVTDLHEISGLTLVGEAAVLAALCSGYFLVRKSHAKAIEPSETAQFEKEKVIPFIE
jgi:uncharacterized membrane protein (DUF373 family)